MTTKNSQNPWTMDVRVRERNLRSGALTEKDLDKHLSGLPDLEGQYDSFSTPQPALAQPPAPPVSEVDESDSDLGDESSDDVGDGGDEPVGGES